MGSHYRELKFTIANTGGAAATATVDVPEQEMGRFTEIEAQLEVDEPTAIEGASGPTLDVKLQSAMDGFADEDMAHDLVHFARAEGATKERKIAASSPTGLVLLGRQQRIHLTAGSTAEGYAWTGKVRLFWRHI
jgi:hypothetical protein